jgi:hypothetical protein
MTIRQTNYLGILIMLQLLSTPAMSQFGVASGLVSTSAVQSLQLLVSRADEAYRRKEYKRAFELYQSLAKNAGDKFSQYRLALMYAQGWHVEKNTVEAYAWSSLAAETEIPEFLAYQQQLEDQLEINELIQARKRANHLIENFGVFQQAYTSSKLLRRKKFSCTGSRVGNTCDRVASSGFGCAIGADRPPSETCLRMGRMGLNSVTGTFPLKLRQVEIELRELMRIYNPGQVTLGELELIDDGEGQTNGAGEDQQPKSDEDDN